MDNLFQIESLEDFENMSQSVVTSLYYPGISTIAQQDINICEKAKHDMKTIISECDFDKENVMNFFCNKDWQEEKVKYFVSLVEQNWLGLLSAALNTYNSSYGETVTNFDWIVKYVLGTSEMKTLKYPLLQLIFSTLNKIGQQNSTMFDIKKDVLLKMINSLENME